MGSDFCQRIGAEIFAENSPRQPEHFSGSANPRDTAQLSPRLHKFFKDLEVLRGGSPVGLLFVSDPSGILYRVAGP